MTSEGSAARAARFRAALQDGELREGLDHVASEITAEWRNCHDAVERENLWRALHILDRLSAFMLSAEKSDLTALRRLK